MSSTIRIKIEDVDLCKLLRVVKGEARNTLIEKALLHYASSEEGHKALALFKTGIDFRGSKAEPQVAKLAEVHPRSIEQSHVEQEKPQVEQKKLRTVPHYEKTPDKRGNHTQKKSSIMGDFDL